MKKLVFTITAIRKVVPAYINFGNIKRCRMKKSQIPANVVLAVNGSGSMDEDLMCDNLEKVIKPYVGGLPMKITCLKFTLLAATARSHLKNALRTGLIKA